ncbi:MAG: hypothetical protein QW423_00905 [Candidatus Aenigmatarchaeota archaeon]
MVKKKIAWEFYIVSAAITLFILFMGIYTGFFLSKTKIKELQDELTSLKLRQEDMIFELTLLTRDKNISCYLLGKALEKTMEEAGKLGDRVSIYEMNEKIKYKDFLDLKKDYTLVLIKYWFYVKEIKESCNRSDLVDVLYFYSNKNCNECSPQGTILTYLKKKYSQNLMIFAIDYDIDLNTVHILKKVYNIEKVPSLVINEEKYEGLVTLEELSEILCSKHKLC